MCYRGVGQEFDRWWEQGWLRGRIGRSAGSHRISSSLIYPKVLEVAVQTDPTGSESNGNLESS